MLFLNYSKAEVGFQSLLSEICAHLNQTITGLKQNKTKSLQSEQEPVSLIITSAVITLTTGSESVFLPVPLLHHNCHSLYTAANVLKLSKACSHQTHPKDLTLKGCTIEVQHLSDQDRLEFLSPTLLKSALLQHVHFPRPYFQGQVYS